MTSREFEKLPSDKQAEVHQAYLALMSPSNLDRTAGEPAAESRVIPRGHLVLEQKVAIGQWLIQTKASLPRGHFGPWLEKQKGLTRSMALQCAWRWPGSAKARSNPRGDYQVP